MGKRKSGKTPETRRRSKRVKSRPPKMNDYENDFESENDETIILHGRQKQDTVHSNSVTGLDTSVEDSLEILEMTNMCGSNM